MERNRQKNNKHSKINLHSHKNNNSLQKMEKKLNAFSFKNIQFH